MHLLNLFLIVITSLQFKILNQTFNSKLVKKFFLKPSLKFGRKKYIDCPDFLFFPWNIQLSFWLLKILTKIRQKNMSKFWKISRQKYLHFWKSVKFCDYQEGLHDFHLFCMWVKWLHKVNILVSFRKSMAANYWI